jgi:hypothetical protein
MAVFAEVVLCWHRDMRIDEIERAIERLSPEDQAKLRAKSGRLDAMFEDSEEDFKAGRYRPLWGLRFLRSYSACVPTITAKRKASDGL